MSSFMVSFLFYVNQEASCEAYICASTMLVGSSFDWRVEKAIDKLSSFERSFIYLSSKRIHATHQHVRNRGLDPPHRSLAQTTTQTCCPSTGYSSLLAPIRPSS